MFPIRYAKVACDFSARIALIIPKLHHNAAVPKLAFCKLLSHRKLVGAWRFELQTPCAQGIRASFSNALAFNASLQNQELNPSNRLWLAVSGYARLVAGWLQKRLQLPKFPNTPGDFGSGRAA